MRNEVSGNIWISGYKIFSKDSYWKNSDEIVIGKTYVYSLEDDKGGFHFCKNIEDTFIFFKYNEGACLYEVCGGGDIINYENDYYEVYDVYAASMLKIVKKVTREDVVSFFYNFNFNLSLSRLLRFIQLFSLTDREILLFKEKFKNLNIVIKYINYYQENNTDIFVKKRKL